MQAYLDIVRRTLEEGRWKGNRTGIRTLAIPNVHFSCNMGQTRPGLYTGFPLLTTKKMAVRTMATELEGFIGGITDKQWYQDRKCKIWHEWSNPVSVNAELHNAANNPEDYPSELTPADLKKHIQAEGNDLGPIYGYQWRRFGVPYIERGEDNSISVKEKLDPWSVPYDQLNTIVGRLKTNPNDRRMVCSAWNPNQLHQQALPPCHLLWVLTHIDGVLNLHWTQRSCDLMLGVPFNIAGYGLLLCLLAAHSGLEPGNLSGMLCDCHIYENQIKGVKEQLKRKPRPLPSIEILKQVEEVPPFRLVDKLKENWNIFNWQATQIKLHDYNPHEKITFGDIAI